MSCSSKSSCKTMDQKGGCKGQQSATGCNKDAKSSCGKYKLTYFNGRGRAELCRLVFAAAGIQYEEVNVSREDWKKSFQATTPWGGLPVLEVDGQVLGQSITIARYIAKEGGLAGKTNYEQALIDSAADTITELREKLIGLLFTPDGPKKDEAAKELREKTIPTTAEALQKFAGNKKFIASDQMSWADIHFFSVFEAIILKANNTEVFKDYPKLKEIYDRVEADPKIAEYIKNRPQRDF